MAVDDGRVHVAEEQLEKYTPVAFTMAVEHVVEFGQKAASEGVDTRRADLASSQSKLWAGVQISTIAFREAERETNTKGPGLKPPAPRDSVSGHPRRLERARLHHDCEPIVSGPIVRDLPIG